MARTRGIESGDVVTNESTYLMGYQQTRTMEEPYGNALSGEEETNHEWTPSKSCCTDSTKSIVFGAIDGICTVLAVFCAASGAGNGWKFIVSVSLSVIFASAFSMGMSEFFSSKAHKEFLMAEKRKELWEFKHHREQEIAQMVSRFESKGMTKKDAESVVFKIAQYENVFVSMVISDELGIQIPDGETDSALLKDAFIMFASFCGFGWLALAPFALVFAGVVEEGTGWLCCVFWALLLLGMLGASKSSFSNSSVWQTSCEVLCLGVICASAAYFGGVIFSNMLDDY